MTSPARRRASDRRTLPRAEWDRLLRERVYLRPIPVAPPLHVMARRRIVTAGTDSPADNTATERNEP